MERNRGGTRSPWRRIRDFYREPARIRDFYREPARIRAFYREPAGYGHRGMTDHGATRLANKLRLSAIALMLVVALVVVVVGALT